MHTQFTVGLWVWVLYVQFFIQNIVVFYRTHRICPSYTVINTCAHQRNEQNVGNLPHLLYAFHNLCKRQCKRRDNDTKIMCTRKIRTIKESNRTNEQTNERTKREWLKRWLNWIPFGWGFIFSVNIIHLCTYIYLFRTFITFHYISALEL